MRRIFLPIAFSITLAGSLAAYALASVTAYAQKAPEVPFHAVNMTALLHDDKGKPVPDIFDRDAADPQCAKCSNMTVGDAIAGVLDAQYEDEKTLPWEQKIARGMLAERLKADTAATLSATEVATVEKLLGKMFGPTVLVQIVPLIDPNFKAPALQ